MPFQGISQLVDGLMLQQRILHRCQASFTAAPKADNITLLHSERETGQAHLSAAML